MQNRGTGTSMRRRELIILIGGSAAWARRVLAQQTKIPVIGFLSPRTVAASVIAVETFRRGMAELGHEEGKSYAVQFRYAEGRYELLPRFAEQLVAAKVDIIVALGSPSVRAAQ